MSLKNVLLLNPSNHVGDKVIKDQYCSFTSKADYFWVPIDLLVLSGDLAKHFNIKVIDATAQALEHSEVLSRCLDFKADHIVILSSLLTHEYDRSLVRKIKESFPHVKTTFVGDIFYFSPLNTISFEEVDSIIYEYPSPELVDFIQNGYAGKNIIYKDNDGKVIQTPKRSLEEIVYETPRHDIFDLENYSVPFMLEDKCTSVLTNFGCKYTCNYCPASSVTFRQRPTSEIIKEIQYVKSLGIRNVWIRDFTFGLKKDVTLEFLDKLRDQDVDWFCLSRAETLDKEIIVKMADSGCYLTMVGVDSISDKTMPKISRKQKDTLIRDRIAFINQNNMQVLVHMILGFPGDSLSSMLRTIHFLSSTKASFLSINFFSPRAGSQYFDELTIKKLNSRVVDSNYAIFSDGQSSAIIVLLKFYAMVVFYLNPVRVARILWGIRSKRQFKLILRTGLKLFSKTNV